MRLVLVLVLANLAAWAVPVVADGGVLNAASFTLRGLPGHGIAQGSTFVVFGAGLGPNQLVVVSSFPLPIDLEGTSIQVRSGGQTFDCIMVFTSAGQLAAILPSNTPVGLAELRVTNNQETSDWVVIEVAASRFGVFARNEAGSGPAIVQNFQAPGVTPVNALTEVARPGQYVILWGTGLGGIHAKIRERRPLPPQASRIHSDS
ncbi:MAG: hypothetical protein GY953_27125 [bacterium]|nr:hypothetical protein [bacterium]